jgi:NADH dehydrogenase
MNSPWKVVIVGGGFGGLSDLVDVTLVDRRNYHLFQPLLYQVATGSLSAGEIASPLRGILGRQKNTRVLLGTVVDVDPDSKSVFLADGAMLPYDSLIVAASAQTSYFGHNKWQEWAPGLKSIEEATTIRHKILYAFEVAERLSDPAQRRAWLTFVIVGGWPTGVELAGAIPEIARQALKNDFRSIHPEEAVIKLSNGTPRVLMPFPEEPRGESNAFTSRAGHRCEVRRNGSACGHRWFNHEVRRANRFRGCEDCDLGGRHHGVAIGQTPNHPHESGDRQRRKDQGSAGPDHFR